MWPEGVPHPLPVGVPPGRRFVTGTCPKCKYEDARGDQVRGCRFASLVWGERAMPAAFAASACAQVITSRLRSPVCPALLCCPWTAAPGPLVLQCDACGSLLNPTELINPKCKLTGAPWAGCCRAGCTARAEQHLPVLAAVTRRLLNDQPLGEGSSNEHPAGGVSPCYSIVPAAGSTHVVSHRLPAVPAVLRCAGSTPVVRQTKHIFLDLPQLSPALQAYIDATSTQGGWSSNCVQVGGWAGGCRGCGGPRCLPALQAVFHLPQQLPPLPFCPSD